MKKIRLTLTMLCLLVLGFNLSAQETQHTDSLLKTRNKPPFTLFKGQKPYRTWSVGVHAGALAPVVFAPGNYDFSNWEVNLGYGLSVRKQLAHSFGLEFNATAGKISGNNKDLLNGIGFGLKSYETSIYTSSIMGVVNVATLDFLRKENWINFLVKAGWGQSAFSYTQTDEFDITTDYKGTYGKSGTEQFRYESFVPVGVGVKFKISERMHFDLGYTMHFSGSDFMDGLKINRTSPDKFSYAYSGLEFSLGKKNRPSLDWVNPISLMYDDLYLRNDSAELAALRKRVKVLEKDVDDLKCDTDSDGIGDLFDKCPSTPRGVVVSGSGCPLDTDEDGIADYLDKCPLVIGPKTNNGCPEVAKAPVISRPSIQLSAEEQKILQDVFENLEFATGKWIIKTVSYPSLNKLATLLITKPNYSLKISGHTDAVGSEKANQTLSVNRANAVKSYLVKKGVSKNKIEARGFGESQPVADNETEEGRQRNRRVEFNIF